MTTTRPIHATKARGAAAPGLKAVALAGLLGFVSLAASSAAVADAGAGNAGPDTATSVAVVELVPIQTASEAAAPPVEAPAPSAPRETALGSGSASYYAAKFHGRRTASGERFDNAEMTAAHRSLPFGTRVRVTNPANGRSVVVRINDRGPFTRGRLIDVSRAAAEELGLVARGHATVELALIAD